MERVHHAIEILELSSSGVHFVCTSVREWSAAETDAAGSVACKGGALKRSVLENLGAIIEGATRSVEDWR